MSKIEKIANIVFPCILICSALMNSYLGIRFFLKNNSLFTDSLLLSAIILWLGSIVFIFLLKKNIKMNKEAFNHWKKLIEKGINK